MFQTTNQTIFGKPSILTNQGFTNLGLTWTHHNPPVFSREKWPPKKPGRHGTSWRLPATTQRRPGPWWLRCDCRAGPWTHFCRPCGLPAGVGGPGVMLGFGAHFTLVKPGVLWIFVGQSNLYTYLLAKWDEPPKWDFWSCTNGGQYSWSRRPHGIRTSWDMIGWSCNKRNHKPSPAEVYEIDWNRVHLYLAIPRVHIQAGCIHSYKAIVKEWWSII